MAERCKTTPNSHTSARRASQPSLRQMCPHLFASHAQLGQHRTPIWHACCTPAAHGLPWHHPRRRQPVNARAGHIETQFAQRHKRHAPCCRQPQQIWLRSRHVGCVPCVGRACHFRVPRLPQGARFMPPQMSPRSCMLSFQKQAKRRLDSQWAWAMGNGLGNFNALKRPIARVSWPAHGSDALASALDCLGQACTKCSEATRRQCTAARGLDVLNDVQELFM